MKKQLIRLGAASTVAGLILGAAAVAGASSASIGTTGPNSHNEVEWQNRLELRLNNHNDLHLTNNNPQTARTGSAEVEHNTIGGDATSGDASNESSLEANVSINNSNGGFGELFENGMGNDTANINLTGPNSHNEVEFHNQANVNVTNDNHVNVTNNNTQNATSGSAEVSGNTEGGSATSGNASNTSYSSFSVDITN